MSFSNKNYEHTIALSKYYWLIKENLVVAICVAGRKTPDFTSLYQRPIVKQTHSVFLTVD